MPINHYPLSFVVSLIDNGDYVINHDALQDALLHFAWGPTDILDAIKSLDENLHCYASEAHHSFQGSFVDKYRAPSLKDGENVYTHFYVRNGKLIINSFHDL